MVMSKLDEQDIIQIFQRHLGNKKFIPEDVEVFSDINIANTDTLVESTDMLSEMTLSDAARKSIVAAASDFAAKGVKPTYAMVSVNMPKTVSRKDIVQIATGFKKACNQYHIVMLGGDTNAGKEFVFNVCIFGKSDKIIKRSGAKAGDLIFVTGAFGYTSVGLNMLLKKIKSEKKFANKAINHIMKPKLKLDFSLKNKKYFTSAMDSSDGLSTTLNEMSRQSRKKFVIKKIPANKDLINYAKLKKINLENLVFHGGEEYEFAFTIPPRYHDMVKKNAKLLATPIIEIGYVRTGSGVFLENCKKHVKLRDLGWKHFK